MMKNRDKVIAEIGRAQGVMMTMYAMLRDMGIVNMVDEDKNGKMGDVLGDTMQGLDSIVEVWDYDPAQDEGGDDE